MRFVVPIAVLLAAGPAANAAPLAERLYDVSTTTGMPHLDENLRHAVVEERRCLGEDDLATAFWMLRDVSLQDCTLRPVPDDGEATAAGDDSRRFDLVCTGGHGTTGSARWRLDGERLSGTLHVRLGGKNMTFYQRITARDAGPCPHPRPARAR